MLIAISIFQFVHGRKMSSSNYKFFFERDFAQQPKSALILTTLHVLFDTLYVNCNDQIMALAATICSTSKETLSKNPYALGVILTTCTILHFVWSWNSNCKGIRTKHWLKSRYKMVIVLTTSYYSDWWYNTQHVGHLTGSDRLYHWKFIFTCTAIKLNMRQLCVSLNQGHRIVYVTFYTLLSVCSGQNLNWNIW